MKAQVVRAADLASERVGPVAAQAREAAIQAREAASHARGAAGDRIYVAREWAAPKLDAAAHSVEEQLAPKVSALLSQAASKVDPTPRTRSRRWPTLLLLTGLAVGAVGFALYRKSADQWTDAMKENASDASRWASEKARSASAKVSDVAEEAKAKIGAKADQAGEKAEHAADQASKKLP
ncbi:hypothetical protein [Streptosporangium carneum]|uniref:hypothetical protein n=1 Tax=Streptosporangium carneum TaxID=47481 RepID=UPI0022F2E5BD|nr:hypothetical protein [Streptosporangium carneum]